MGSESVTWPVPAAGCLLGTHSILTILSVRSQHQHSLGIEKLTMPNNLKDVKFKLCLEGAGGMLG